MTFANESGCLNFHPSLAVLSLPYLPDRMSAAADDTHELNERARALLNGS